MGPSAMQRRGSASDMLRRSGKHHGLALGHEPTTLPSLPHGIQNRRESSGGHDYEDGAGKPFEENHGGSHNGSFNGSGPLPPHSDSEGLSWANVQLQKRVRQLETELLQVVQGQQQAAAMGGPAGPRRFVGGAQFRGVGRPAPPSQCEQCIHFHNQIKKLKRASSNSAMDVQVVQERMNLVETHAAQVEDEKQRIATQATYWEEQVATLQRELEATRARAQRAIDAERGAMLRQSELKVDNDSLRLQVKELESTLNAAKKTAGDAKRAAQEAREAADRHQRAAAQAHRDLNDAVQSREHAALQHRRELDAAAAASAAAAAAQMRQQVEAANARAAASAGEADAMRVYVTKLQSEIDDLMAKLAQRSAGPSQEQLAHYEAALAALRAELAAAKANLEQAIAREAIAAQQVELQRATVTELMAELEALRAALEKGKEREIALAAEVEELNAQLRALKDAMQKNAGQDIHLGAEMELLRKQVAEGKAALSKAQGALAEAEAAAAAAAEQAAEQAAAAAKKLSAAEADAAALREELEALKKALAKAKADAAAAAAAAAAELEALKAAHKKELEDLAACKDQELADYKEAVSSTLEDAKNKEKLMRGAHMAAQTAVEEAEARLRKAEMAAETATALAQRSLQQTMQGKLSVSVLAPSVKVSFGGGNDLTVMPDAPKELIEQVLKKQVLPAFCKVFMSEQANVGPDGEDLNKWLGGVMDGMVGAIDDHVVGVLKSQRESAAKDTAKADGERSRRNSSISNGKDAKK